MDRTEAQTILTNVLRSVESEVNETMALEKLWDFVRSPTPDEIRALDKLRDSKDVAPEHVSETIDIDHPASWGVVVAVVIRLMQLTRDADRYVKDSISAVTAFLDLAEATGDFERD